MLELEYLLTVGLEAHTITLEELTSPLDFNYASSVAGICSDTFEELSILLDIFTYSSGLCLLCSAELR